MRKWSVIILCALACGQMQGLCATKYAQNEQRKENEQREEEEQRLEMVEVPTYLKTPEKRAKYLALNYWNNYNFQDTTLIGSATMSEQPFVDFLQVLNITAPKIAEKAIAKNITHAINGSPGMGAYFCEMYETYLSQADSPMRNEDLFIAYLRTLISNPKVEAINKIRPEYILELALANRPGQVADNFQYTTTDNKTHSLEELKGEMVLLFFNNPDCHNCTVIKEQTAKSNTIKEKIGTQELKILAIYPGPDLELWCKNTPKIPKDWINGHAINQYIDEKYDLTIIPTLYLIDANQKVIQKNTTLKNVENYLKSLNATKTQVK